MTFVYKITFFILVILFFGCSGQKALNQGDFDLAVHQSSERIIYNKTSAKAIKVLQTAYPLAVAKHQKTINDILQSPNPLKWEDALVEYSLLAKVHQNIYECYHCRALVVMQDSTPIQIQTAKFNAAEVRYQRACIQLAENNKESAKRTYFDFQKALALVPNYKDSDKKMAEAFLIAALKVKLEPVMYNMNYYSINTNALQESIVNFTEQYQKNNFVKFYKLGDSFDEKDIDQILSFSIENFSVGQLTQRESVMYLTKDNIIIGRHKDKQPIYTTVQAKVTKIEKHLNSSLSVSYKVVEAKSQSIISQERWSSDYLWRNEYGYCTGDRRALNSEHIFLINQNDMPAPPNQEFFNLLSYQISNQLQTHLNVYFDKYE